MTTIELTLTETKKLLFINPKKIIAFIPFNEPDKKHTIIYVGRHSFNVVESANEIDDKLLTLDSEE